MREKAHNIPAPAFTGNAKPPEYYGLVWPGKKQAADLVYTPAGAEFISCPEESVDFDHSENIFIEGENLEALKLLQRDYTGKIKMIYIDPPYNTGRKFTYSDKYTVPLSSYLELSGNDSVRNEIHLTGSVHEGRAHTSWLNMMYPRLSLAANLLRCDGVIFISIGQDELANLILIANEIFGEINRISICTRLMKTGGQKGRFFNPNTDYIVIYAKSIKALDSFRDELNGDLIKQVYTQIQRDGLRRGERYREMGLYQPLDIRANQRYYIKCPDGEFVLPPGNSFPDSRMERSKVKPGSGDGVWRWIYKRYREELQKENIVFKITTASPLITAENKKSKWNIYTKIWLNDRIERGKVPLDIFDGFENRHSARELIKLGIPFDYAKPSSLISYLAGLCSVGDNDIVLDFFAGSGTTAHAVFELNRIDRGCRKFILVQLPEACSPKSEAAKRGFRTVADIAKERIRRVIHRIKEEYAAGASGAGCLMDMGFKVLKLENKSIHPVVFR